MSLFRTDGNNIESTAKSQVVGSVNSISCSPDGSESICATDRGFIYRVRNTDLAKVSKY